MSQLSESPGKWDFENVPLNETTFIFKNSTITTIKFKLCF